jgi:hypothetical protein
MSHELERAWRDKWLVLAERPLHLSDLTCATCGFVPDWLEMVPSGSPPLSFAQNISRERQQSQLLFHLQSKGHTA